MPDGVRPVFCKECLSKKKEEKRLELEQRKITKEIERKHLEEDNIIAGDGPALSLADLSRIEPVDFKGRKLKNTNPHQVTSPANSPSSDVMSSLADDKISAEVEDIFNQHLKNSTEHDLAEGEDVIIGNNQF